MNAKRHARAAMLAGALAAAVFAAGAAAQGRYVAAEENVAKIRVGTTSAKQVEELLGAPLRKYGADRRGLDSWEYKLFNYGDVHTLWISLSADGVVREVVQARERYGA